MPRRARAWYRTDRAMWYTTLNGKQTPLGVTDPTDQAGADAALKALVDQLAAGLAARLQPAAPPSAPPATPAPPPAPPPSVGPTVTEAVAGFLAAGEKKRAAGKLKTASLANYRQQLGHLVKGFGPRLLSSLTAEELEEWADREEWSSSYQHNTLGTVQQLLRWGGIVLAIKRPPKESRGADTCLTDDQFAKVLEAVRRYAGCKGDLVELLKVLRETGARPQEMAVLRVEAVDWDHACTRQREHKTRRYTGTDRVIHFNSAAMAILRAQREEYGEGLLFRTRYGNSYAPKTLVDRLEQISDRVGFRVIAYGLGRHSFATRALTAGVPDVLVAGLLGHKGTGMLHRHYSHVGEQARALKDAAERASGTPPPKAAG